MQKVKDLQILIQHQEEFPTTFSRRLPSNEFLFSGSIQAKNEWPPFRDMKQGFLRGGKLDQNHFKNFKSKALWFLIAHSFRMRITPSSSYPPCLEHLKSSLMFVKAEGKVGQAGFDIKPSGLVQSPESKRRACHPPFQPRCQEALRPGH